MYTPGFIVSGISLLNSNKNEKSFLNEYIPFLDQLNNIQLVVFFVSIFIFVYLIKTLFIVFYNSWGARLMHNMAANLSRKVLQKYLKND